MVAVEARTESALDIGPITVDELLAEQADVERLAVEGSVVVEPEPNKRIRINLTKNSKSVNHDSTCEIDGPIAIEDLELHMDALDSLACRLIVRGISRREAIDRGEFSADVANVAAQVQTAPAPVVEDIKDLPF